jgi:hypothetical protein
MSWATHRCDGGGLGPGDKVIGSWSAAVPRGHDFVTAAFVSEDDTVTVSLFNTTMGNNIVNGALLFTGDVIRL